MTGIGTVEFPTFLFSRSKNKKQFGSSTSASKRCTLSNESAILVATVVFPVPPLPEVIVICVYIPPRINGRTHLQDLLL